MSLSDSEYIVAQAAAVVSQALYFDTTSAKYMDEGDTYKEKWIQRLPTAARVTAYRIRKGIPDSTPDDIIVQAISEDWDME
jgi:hypothetical protein